MTGQGWHYMVRPCRNGALGWLGMAKKSAFTANGSAVHERGDLWFTFGDTEDDAWDKIRAEVKGLGE